MRGLSLHVDFNFEGSDWYGAIAGELARVVQGLPMWSRWTQVRVRGGAPTALTADALEAAIRDADRAWELLDDAGEVALECSHFGDTLLVRLEILEGAWPAYAAELEGIGWRFIEALPAGAVLPISGIRPSFSPDLPWSRVPNRPRANYLRFENVVDFVDRRLIERWARFEGGRVVARMVDAAVPAPARRSEHGSVVMVSFTDALTDEGALAAARMANERWLAAQVSPPGGAGDRRVSASDPVPAPPLTFVDRASRRGFKTVVVFPDESREEAAWDTAVRIARSGAVDGFGALTGVYVIVPLRVHAVALAASARSAGLAGVVYPDGHELWSVEPPIE